MIRVSPKLFSSRITRLTIPFTGALILMALAPVALRAQRPKDALDPDGDNRPAFSDFKGVSIGMRADEARKKLGNPRDKGVEQDFYMFGDNQAVQVFYDKVSRKRDFDRFYERCQRDSILQETLGAEAEERRRLCIQIDSLSKRGLLVSYSRLPGPNDCNDHDAKIQ